MSDVPPPPAPEPVPPVSPPPAAPQYSAAPVYSESPQPNYYPPARPNNTLAIVAMILSLAGLVTGITAIGGIICGHIALSQIKRTGEAGRGFALTGVIVGYVLVGFGVLATILAVILFAVLGTAATTYPYT